MASEFNAWKTSRIKKIRLYIYNALKTSKDSNLEVVKYLTPFELFKVHCL